jgi:threonine dehydrogenase-like Zn-dependent dehydrogenase
MKAYQLTAWQTPPQLREAEVPEPGPGEVLLKVGGAGACHSDLHLMEIGAFGGGLGLDGGMAEYMLVPHPPFAAAAWRSRSSRCRATL